MDPNVLGLQGKRTLVLGGGYGIGRASALLLARAGAPVVVADLDPARADAVAAEVTDLGVAALAISGDVTDRARAESLVDDAASFHGGLDVVINMIGLAAWGSLFELDDDAWDLDLARNLRHHLWTGRAAARHMIDQGTGGALAMVASVSGIYGAPSHAAYGAAKAGVMSLTRTMAQEWGRHGIRVNAVAPDMIATPRIKAQTQAAAHDANARTLESRQPLGRMGEPEEIAGPLVFLVSELSSFVTGQTIIVDGGTHAAFPHFDAANLM
ncbi:MAG: SDR family NAD(P)-dependent oxidoreductase [Acidimicrobiia bacterium]|jgi:2-deoxy-D-gluconate 3-dehydrogenase